MSGWGKGVDNNTIGWGRGSTNDIGWGSIYADSPSGDTAIAVSAPSFTNVYSVDFDGVDDYVTCGTDASLKPTAAISISFWMEGAGSGDDFSLRCGSTTLSNNYGYGFRIAAGDYWFILGNGSSSSSLRVGTPSSGWHHFLCTWNGTTQTMFIDGVSAGTATYATTLAYDAGAFFIGARNAAGSKDFLGKIDEVAIWNSDQSANIGSIYSASGAVDLSSLSPISWWRFEEGSGTNAADSGSASNDGTLTNGAAFSTNIPT